MATIDLKLKSYDELTFEITRLCTDNYLKQIKIDELQQRVDKAKKFIQNHIVATETEEVLLQILQGEDK